MEFLCIFSRHDHNPVINSWDLKNRELEYASDVNVWTSMLEPSPFCNRRREFRLCVSKGGLR